MQGVFHLHAHSGFDVFFPCGVIRVAVALYLDVPNDRCRRCEAEPVSDLITVFVFCLTEETPIPGAVTTEIAVGDPVLVFVRMSSFCPMPQDFVDVHIHTDKRFLGRGVPVKVGPTPYLWVELANQPVRFCLSRGQKIPVDLTG